MTYDELSAKLEGKLQSAYIIRGDDSYLRKRALIKFLELVDPALSDFNVSYIGGAEKVSEAENAAMACPLGGGYKLTVWESGSADKPVTDADGARIKNVLKNAADENIFVMVDGGLHFKTLYSAAEEVDCSKQNISGIFSFVSEKLKSCGKTMGYAEVKNLSAICGTDTGRIMLETDKLIAYVGERVQITQDDIDDAVVPNAEEKVFALTDELSRRNLDKAVTIANGLLLGGSKPSALLGVLTAHYRKLFYSLLSPLNDAELAAVMGVKPNAVSRLRADKRRYSAGQLKAVLEKLRKCEQNFKQGFMTEETALWVAICTAIQQTG